MCKFILHQYEAVLYFCPTKVMGPSPTFLMVGSFLQSKVKIMIGK